MQWESRWLRADALTDMTKVTAVFTTIRRRLVIGLYDGKMCSLCRSADFLKIKCRYTFVLGGLISEYLNTLDQFCLILDIKFTNGDCH